MIKYTKQEIEKILIFHALSIKTGQSTNKYEYLLLHNIDFIITCNEIIIDFIPFTYLALNSKKSLKFKNSEFFPNFDKIWKEYNLESYID